MNKPIPFLNDIVSLFVMLLLTIALIAGEANATAGESAAVRGQDTDQVVEMNPFRLEDKVQ